MIVKLVTLALPRNRIRHCRCLRLIITVIGLWVQRNQLDQARRKQNVLSLNVFKQPVTPMSYCNASEVSSNCSHTFAVEDCHVDYVAENILK